MWQLWKATDLLASGTSWMELRGEGKREDSQEEKRTRGEKRALRVSFPSEGSYRGGPGSLGQELQHRVHSLPPRSPGVSHLLIPWPLQIPWELFKIPLFWWDFQEYLDPAPYSPLQGVDIGG